MSTRQKSFFDQKPRPKYFNRWPNRPHNANTAVHSAAAPPRPVVTGPPIMPSSQTRTKLKKFQFIDGAPDPETIRRRMEAEKENQVARKEDKSAAPKQRVDSHHSEAIEAVEKTAQTPKPASKKSCPPPSTPGTRLPLAELVGNVDDSSRHVVKAVVSPEEQLSWRGSQQINTPLPRKRKRARSSSPVAPSPEEDEPHGQPQDTRQLTTPQANPATELWNHYTNNKGTPTGKKGIAFAHLISEASPRSSATAGSVSGLRRWASCGVEFPTSTRKRRRTHAPVGVFQEVPEDITEQPSSDGNFQGPPRGKTNLVELLEKIRESKARPASRHDTFAPSSSSPLPAPERRNTSTDSPLRNRGQEHSESEEVVETLLDDREVVEQEYEEDEFNTRRSSGSSDEFGDADFDDDIADALEISGQAAIAPEALLSQPPYPNNITTTSSARVPSEPPVVRAADSDDEFGLDEDVFADDFENVASLYDARAERSPEQQSLHDEETNDVQEASDMLLAPPVVDLVDDDEDDEFGDDIDVDEFAAAEIAATQVPATNSSQDARAIQRYLVKRVDEGHFVNDKGHRFPEKVLLVEEEKTKLFKAITLRQAWYDTPCTPDSFVHVIGDFSITGQCIINNAHNMLILHPDHLISATVVADSFGCLRRAVLQDRVKATSRANSPMLYGTLLHELFQEALKANQWDTDFLLETIDRLLPSKFETILEINSTGEEVMEHMKSKLPELQSWAKVFVSAKPRPDALVREMNGKQSLMSINKLLDVEEHVWSPMYGLKGNIDATVQVTMQDDQGERTLTVPFEVKTGKNSSNAAHVAQTALYNLLLSNRYDVDVAYGILYYLETSDTSRIPAIRNDIIHMIIKRNELACYVRDRIELPEMLKEDHKCGKCYAQEACFLYHKLVEDGTGERLNKKAKERFDEMVQDLNPSDQEFLKKWDDLLTKEESDMMKFRRELWTMLSTEREKLGRCFSNVVLEPGSCHEEKNGQKINRYSYTFIKPQPKPGFSFTESQLLVGEPVVVSDEQGHFALANGYVTNVRKRRITVAVDRRLHNSRTKLPNFHSQNNQTFTGIMEVTKEDEPISVPQYQSDEDPVLYRLDKDEFSNGMAAARNNLIQIMDDSVYKARDLRALIVGNRAPAFTAIADTSLPESSQMSMNSDQKAAVSKVMSAKDYALVLGMPGTGKTTTIAHIIRTLVAKGKSVLLTSYTHTAVDNILLKIKNDNIGVLRIGASAKVHPEVRQFATLAAETKDSLEELEKSWTEPPVVATTCLSINHPLFNRRIFDYCIVDEASQITLPVCLGPIRMSQKFILVGDHYQLPPLVQNKQAAEGGLDTSLFKLLCEAHPQAVVSLEHQYRMCADIMLLSNTFIYSGRLKCGTPSVASRQLTLPNPTGLAAYHNPHSSHLTTTPCPGPTSPSCWLSRSLSPSSPVIFINTDPISTNLETASGPRILNTLEARLITHLTLSLLSLGVSPSEIGIIALYRSQLALLRSSLFSASQTQHSEPSTAGVELHTADRFQGRDKEVVLVSCVRSNEGGVVGELLKDRRRVNVAMTRARSKLVILGSERTLSGNELMRDVVGVCRERGWVVDVTLEMVEGHGIGEGVGGTQGVEVRNGGQSKSLGQEVGGKRKVLGDITNRGETNASAGKRVQNTLGGSPEVHPSKNNNPGYKVPKKVCQAGKKSVLDGRPVLQDIFNDAI